MTHTVALIHGKPGAYGISFPDYPGCISTAGTIDELVRKGAEALTFHVAGMVEDGDPQPVLRTLDEIRADPDVATDDGVFAVVPFDLPGRAVRVNISLDENLLGAIDSAAQAVGQSRSAFLAAAAREKIRA